MFLTSTSRSRLTCSLFQGNKRAHKLTVKYWLASSSQNCSTHLLTPVWCTQGVSFRRARAAQRDAVSNIKTQTNKNTKYWHQAGKDNIHWERGIKLKVFVLRNFLKHMVLMSIKSHMWLIYHYL